MPPTAYPTPAARAIALLLLAAVSAAVFYWNGPLFALLNGHPTRTADRLFGLVSGLGDGLVAVVLILTAALYRARLGLAALAAFLLSGLLAQLLKRWFDLPRPPALFDHLHLLGAPLFGHSFPSGHATTDGVMATASLLFWRRRPVVSAAAALLFLLAAVGRVYGGVHFPRDVWAGLLLGVASMLLCHRAAQRWPVPRWQHGRWWRPGLTLLLAASAGVLGLGYRIQPTTAQPLALLIPTAALYLLARRWRRA
ncbi:MAG: phosphatase PAP2 family protein [Zetaproteobacteria bacterium]|nr:MAG: phosphatase PAP2 family protein [Zetaproteobacteria bacterium]